MSQRRQLQLLADKIADIAGPVAQVGGGPGVLVLGQPEKPVS